MIVAEVEIEGVVKREGCDEEAMYVSERGVEGFITG